MWTTFSGSGGVVVDDGRVLMVRQRRHYGVHWEFPSGYNEPGESYEQAAAREVLEETGIEVEIGELVCTMVWEREHDQRRNLLAYFLATPLAGAPEPRAQIEEEIEAASFIDPTGMEAEIHPMHRAILDRWWESRSARFHLHVDVLVGSDGTQDYVFSS